MSADKFDTGVNTATKQAVCDRDERGRFMAGNKPVTGFHTNPERRSSGSWNKNDTSRHKLEKMMQLTSNELFSMLKKDNTSLFERRLALAIIDGSWPVIRDMMNQVYGSPRSSVEVNTEPTNSIIKGFVMPTAPDQFIDDHGQQVNQGS